MKEVVLTRFVVATVSPKGVVQVAHASARDSRILAEARKHFQIGGSAYVCAGHLHHGIRGDASVTHFTWSFAVFEVFCADPSDAFPVQVQDLITEALDGWMISTLVSAQAQEESP